MDLDHLSPAPESPAVASGHGTGFERLRASMAGLTVATERLRALQPGVTPRGRTGSPAASSPAVIDLRTEPPVAPRPDRVASELAEALVERANARSALLLEAAEVARTGADEALESAEREREARRREAEAGRDPIGQAIRRAVASVLDAP